MRYQYTSPSFKSSFNPSQLIIPDGLKKIIFLNVAIFILLELSGLKLDIFRQFGLIPSKILFNMAIWQPFTYMFLHDGFFHILLNMLFLWIFGREVETTWGKIAFYKYYMTTGGGSGLLNALINYNSTIPVVGASGAVFGILLAFGIFLVSNEMGIVRWYKLNRERNLIQEEINILIQQESELTNELDRLINDKDYIKQIAKEKFYMVRPGEKVFRVIDRKKVK